MPRIVPMPDGNPLPGVAPVAVQQGRYVAMLIREETAPDQRRPFVYADRGMLATIGRAQAVAQIGLMRLSGLSAWLLWCVVHIFLLIEFRSRVRVMSEWVWTTSHSSLARESSIGERTRLAKKRERHRHHPRDLTRRNESTSNDCGPSLIIQHFLAHGILSLPFNLSHLTFHASLD